MRNLLKIPIAIVFVGMLMAAIPKTDPDPYPRHHLRMAWVFPQPNFTAHWIISVVPAEYKTWYIRDDNTIWGYNNGSTYPVLYPLGAGGLRSYVTGCGAFNFIWAIDDSAHLFHSAYNFNTDVSTNMYKINTDTTGADFGSNWYVDAYGQMVCTIRSDSSVWYGGQDYFSLFYAGGDPLLETGTVMAMTQLSPTGWHFKKVLFGGNRIIGLRTDGNVYQWSQGGSRTPTLLSTPRAAIDIFVSHLDVTGAIVPDPGENSGLGYPYIMGSGWAMWGGSTTVSSLTSMKSLWGMSVPIKEIKCNWSDIHFIDSLGRHFGGGFNSQGEAGNGAEFIGKYTYPTFPNYVWPFNDFENPTGVPVQIGTATNWVHLYSNNWYTFYWYAIDANDSIYSWGRNKTGVLGNGYTLGFTTAPSNSNLLDILSPTMVHPFTSPYKVFNSYKKPVVNCPKQTLSGVTATTLNSYDTCTMVFDAPGTDTVNYGPPSSHLWAVVSKPVGSPTVVFGTPTAASTTASNLAVGTTIFSHTIQDQHSGSAIGYDTVTVNATGTTILQLSRRTILH
jgi:hypothetical protein